MNNSQRLLLRVLERVPNKSTRGLATAIGADRTNTRKYLRGERYPNATHALKIAEILGISFDEVVLYIQEDKTKNPDAKELLKRKLPRLHSAAAVTLALLAGTIFGGNQDASASTIAQEKIIPSYTLCEVMGLPDASHGEPTATHFLSTSRLNSSKSSSLKSTVSQRVDSSCRA